MPTVSAARGCSPTERSRSPIDVRNIRICDAIRTDEQHPDHQVQVTDRLVPEAVLSRTTSAGCGSRNCRLTSGIVRDSGPGRPVLAVDLDEEVTGDPEGEEVDRRSADDLVGSHVDGEERVDQAEDGTGGHRRHEAELPRVRPCRRRGCRRSSRSASSPRGRCSRRRCAPRTSRRPTRRRSASQRRTSNRSSGPSRRPPARYRSGRSRPGGRRSTASPRSRGGCTARQRRPRPSRSSTRPRPRPTLPPRPRARRARAARATDLDSTGGRATQKPSAETAIPAQASRLGTTAQRTTSLGDAERALIVACPSAGFRPRRSFWRACQM